MTDKSDHFQDLIAETARALFDDDHSGVTPMLRGEPFLLMYLDHPEILVCMLMTMFSPEAQGDEGEPPIDLSQALAGPMFAVRADAIIDASHKMATELADMTGIIRPSRADVMEELSTKCGLEVGREYSGYGVSLSMRLGQIEMIEAAILLRQQLIATKLAAALVEGKMAKDDLSDRRITPEFRDQLVIAVVAQGISEGQAREKLAAVGLTF